MHTRTHAHTGQKSECKDTGHGVASSSRLLKTIGFFCKRALQKRRYSAEETYDFKEPTNRSHPIPTSIVTCMCLYVCASVRKCERMSVGVGVCVCVCTRMIFWGLIQTDTKSVQTFRGVCIFSKAKARRQAEISNTAIAHTGHT